MKKDQINRRFPDFWLTICQEAKEGRGEDSFCRCFCNGIGLLGVFDGCGGLGAQTREEFSNATEAYIASRLCAGVFYQSFQEASKHKMAEFHKLVSENCSRVLSSCKPIEAMTAQVRGSMVKMLPTTAAAVMVSCLESGHDLTSLWAGDSRIYLMTADGLAQLTQDDTTVPDPMDNLYEDGILKNILCAESAPNLHQKNFSIQEPFVVFAATDGCFGYFSTPMEFEGALLLTMMESKNAAEWENSLLEHIGQVAGDDYTLVAAAYGFDTFQNLQSALFPRWQFLKQTQLCVISELPLLDREARIGLWQKYKENYFRYVEQ